ncbi:hypothetical protein HPP92_027716 [Vanilla planifolia]|uniref:Uncharacterized protein n=1 Tax=Vanilla planifolia TaxID=51239 RepID=A0A835PAS0_VANPL|nr:hypothetical protein HPP92_027716 [Vanilla planifolia]
MRERDLAEEEAVRFRNVVKRQRKEFRSRMVEVEREESEQKRVVDERANTRWTCKSLARLMIEGIQSTFSAYDGIGMNFSIQVDTTKFLDNLEESSCSAVFGSEDALNKLDVWAKERDVVGLKASINSLTSNVQCFNKLCLEWKEVEDSLRKKSKKIEEAMEHERQWQAEGDCATHWTTMDTIGGNKCIVILERYLRFKVNEDFKRKLEEDVCGCERALLESMGPAVAIGPEANINNF